MCDLPGAKPLDCGSLLPLFIVRQLAAGGEFRRLENTISSPAARLPPSPASWRRESWSKLQQSKGFAIRLAR
jgi:hypothetical protein